MKRVFLLVLAVIAMSPAFAGEGNKKKSPAANSINWMTWDEVQTAMKKKPKKVWVDIYTDWCGWCKVMDKKTFSHPEVIKYMNDNFYAVKFNSEKDDNIRFRGKMYSIKPENKVNDLAIELLRGQLSYPTFVFMEENFQNPIPVPGYQPAPQLQMILTYLKEEKYKTVQFEDYQKTYVPTWKEEVAQN